MLLRGAATKKISSKRGGMKKMAAVGSIGLAALEALPVDDGWARFVILLFRNPHLLEG